MVEAQSRECTYVVLVTLQYREMVQSRHDRCHSSTMSKSLPTPLSDMNKEAHHLYVAIFLHWYHTEQVGMIRNLSCF